MVRGVVKGDTRSLDYSSNGEEHGNMIRKLWRIFEWMTGIRVSQNFPKSGGGCTFSASPSSGP